MSSDGIIPRSAKLSRDHVLIIGGGKCFVGFFVKRRTVPLREKIWSMTGPRDRECNRVGCNRTWPQRHPRLRCCEDGAVGVQQLGAPTSPRRRNLKGFRAAAWWRRGQSSVCRTVRAQRFLMNGGSEMKAVGGCRRIELIECPCEDDGKLVSRLNRDRKLFRRDQREPRSRGRTQRRDFQRHQALKAHQIGNGFRARTSILDDDDDRLGHAWTSRCPLHISWRDNARHHEIATFVRPGCSPRVSENAGSQHPRDRQAPKNQVRLPPRF